MKFIKNIFRNFIQWAVREDVEINYKSHRGIGVTSPRIHAADEDLSDNAIRFQIINAVGGKIVKISEYDSRTDRSKSTLYIISSTDNIGEELSQIITREMLSR